MVLISMKNPKYFCRECGVGYILYKEFQMHFIKNHMHLFVIRKEVELNEKRFNQPTLL